MRQLVQDSWALVEPDIEEHGVKFFMRIFEIAPPALQLFSFRDEVHLEQSPALRAHASVVMRTVGQAVAGLSDLQTLVPVLQRLGAGHAEYGVQPEHFAIVGSSLLWTLEIGLSGAGAWTPEVKDAWSKTYATVQSVMEPALSAENQKRNATKLARAQAAQTLFKTGVINSGVMVSEAKEVGGSTKTEGLPKEGESSSSSRQSAAETSPDDPMAAAEAKVGVAGAGQALSPEAEEKLPQETQQHSSHRRKSSGGGSSSGHLVDMSYRNNRCNGRDEGDTVSQMSSERSHGGGLDDDDDDDEDVSSSDGGGGDYETSSDEDSSEDQEAGSEGRAGRKSGMRTPKGRGGCSSPNGESPVTELTKRSPRPAASAAHQILPPIYPPALSLGSVPAHETNNVEGGAPKVAPPLKSDMELLESILCENPSAARARISKSRGGVRDPTSSLVSSIAPKGEWGTDSVIKTGRSSNKAREWDCVVDDDDCVTDDRSLGKKMRN